MVRVYLALYKGRKTGRKPSDLAARLADWVIRKATRSPYSHCEIAIDWGDGGGFDCYSSSMRDGGVRLKKMDLPSEKWDLLPVPVDVVFCARGLFMDTRGAKYDLRGALLCGLGVLGGYPERWFCSEWCAAALGLGGAARYTPSMLADYCAARLKGAPSPPYA